LHPPSGATGRSTGGIPTGVAIGLAFGIGLAVPRLFGPSPTVAAAEVSASGAVFVGYAAGVVPRPVAVQSAPGRGDALALLPSGAEVLIGGRAEFSAGVSRAEALWVSARSGADTGVYGFVPASAVEIRAGHAPQLDLAGVPIAALLSPLPAVAGAGAAIAGEVPPPGDTVSAPGREGPAFGDGTDSAGRVGSGIPWLPGSVGRWWPQIVTAGEAHGIDPELLAIVMVVESGGHAAAASPAGATGLMQVMPATGADIAAQRGVAGFAPEQLWDPATNIDFGAWYLADQMRRFGNGGADGVVVALAAAAYNGGPGTVQRHLRGAALPTETQRYQQWVGGMWRERHDARSPTFDAWWAAGGRRLVEMAEAAAGR